MRIDLRLQTEAGFNLDGAGQHRKIHIRALQPHPRRAIKGAGVKLEDAPMSRDCLAPRTPEPPGFAVPEGACDSHTHVFGPYARYPLAEDRSYTPPENDGAALLRQLDALGLARCVIVTASAYGADNRAMLDALALAPDRLRGVAVLSEEVTEPELDALTAAGVRGVRVNLFRRDGHQVYRNGMGLEVLSARSRRG
ncbi:amidohydrolase family protein [Methylobacterium oryzae CBMB20]